MLEVTVGVALTAILGGLLAPLVKDEMDRRRLRLDASVELVETLANGLWAYWKLALRVAYYGRQGQAEDGYKVALLRWDSDDAWSLGSDIQTQVSRSKRLLPGDSARWLDEAQQKVVTYLDDEIDRLRASGTQDEWAQFYDALMTTRRDEIDELLSRVTHELKLERNFSLKRVLRR